MNIEIAKIIGLCAIEGCVKKVHAREWCNAHYRRWMRYGHHNIVRPNTEQRFEDKHIRIPESGCWLWTDKLDPAGYGKFRYNGKMHLAHRASYLMHKGPIPDGLGLDHLCRVRCCVNPNHLEPVTQKVNTNRGRNHLREKTHCLRGHPLSGDNLYVDPKGGRRCRTCTKKEQRDRYWRNKNAVLEMK